MRSMVDKGIAESRGDDLTVALPIDQYQGILIASNSKTAKIELEIRSAIQIAYAEPRLQGDQLRQRSDRAALYFFSGYDADADRSLAFGPLEAGRGDHDFLGLRRIGVLSERRRRRRGEGQQAP
jgi:hypothetical protein